MRRKINLSLLGGTILGLVLVCGTIYFVHRWQVDRNAPSLLEHARRAAKNEAHEESLLYYQRYLQRRPNDTQALVEYALTLDKVATSDADLIQVLGLVEQALLRDGQNTKLRREAIRMSLDLGFIKEAAKHIKIVLEEAPNDAKLWFELGGCYASLERFADAERAYREAITYDPKSIQSYVELARLLHHDLDRPQDVLRVLDRMVAANPKSYLVYVSRGRYLQGRGSAKAARKDLARALDLAPKNASILLSLAKLDECRGQLSEAAKWLEQGTKDHPKNEEIYARLSKIHVAQHHPEKAISILRTGLKQVPNARLLNVTLAELLVSAGRLKEADTVLESLRKKQMLPNAAACLQARRWMQEGHWGKSRKLLEDRRTELVKSAWKAQFYFLLGECYRHLGDPDRAILEHQRAISARPGWTLAKYGLAAAFVGANRGTDAVRTLRRLARLPDAPPDTNLLLAEALALQNQQLPPSEQNWTRVGDLVRDLTPEQAKSIRGILARVEWQVAERRFARAREVLQDALANGSISEKEDKLRLRLALADLARTEGDDAKAKRMLTQIEQEFGETPTTFLAWIRFWNSKDTRTARKGLANLAPKIDRFAQDERTPLRRHLALAFAEKGDYAQAIQMMEPIANRNPKDIPSRFFLLDAALRKYRKEQAAKRVRELERLEGPEGTLWRFGRAAWIVAFHSPRDTKSWNEARLQLNRLQKVRPDWTRALLLAGRMAEKEGNEKAAADYYLRAIEVGATQEQTVLKLGELLLRQRRYADATGLVRRLKERGQLSKAESKLAAEVALLQGHKTEAIRFAKAAVSPNARDYRDRLWLANVYEKAGQLTHAGDVLQRLTLHSGYVPDVWIAWVQYLHQTKQQDRIREAFSELRKKMPAERATLTMARCYDAIEETARAEATFRKAAASTDYFAWKHLADFYLRNRKYAKAEAILLKMTDPRNQFPGELETVAKNKLALALARQNDPAKFRKALGLVGEPKNRQSLDPETLRTRGLVLATNPKRVNEAISTLREYLKIRETDVEAMWTLANLYRQRKEYRLAADLLAKLLRQEGNQQPYLVACIETLLAIPNVSEAESYLVELERVAPRSPRTRALRDRVEALRKKLAS